jgi:hypothetical protein
MKTVLSLAGVVVIAAVMAFVWAANCSGPRPEVEQVSLEAPKSPDHPYRVIAVIRNKTGNGGEVTVNFELVNVADGSVTRTKEDVDLNGDETLTVITEIDAPPGEYEPRAKVDYPPR